VEECLPEGAKLEILEWKDTPPFKADDFSDGYPPQVDSIRRRLGRCQGVIIACPEYNFSVPGMLKNLIDWISRGNDQPLAGKPIALLSASTGPLGGARVQYDLRKILLFMNASVLTKPEVFIGQAGSKFNGAGECIDAPTRSFVTAQVSAFSDLINRVEFMSRYGK